MDEAAGALFGVIILIAIAVAVIVFLGMILLWLIGISAGVGAFSGLFLSLKAPFTYLEHLWKRCK